jgi:hypothetical protein
MGEEMPSEFYTRGGIYEFKDKITTPDTLTANMAFSKAPVVWQHRMWGTFDPVREFNNGIFFHGTKASIFAEDAKVTVFNPGRDAKKEELPFPGQLMQEKHVSGFLEAVRKKDRKLLTCTPEDAFMSTATVQLAMISYYTGSTVRWDPVKREIINNQEASKLLKREYRGKYVHP